MFIQRFFSRYAAHYSILVFPVNPPNTDQVAALHVFYWNIFQIFIDWKYMQGRHLIRDLRIDWENYKYSKVGSQSSG